MEGFKIGLGLLAIIFLGLGGTYFGVKYGIPAYRRSKNAMNDEQYVYVKASEVLQPSKKPLPKEEELTPTNAPS